MAYHDVPITVLASQAPGIIEQMSVSRLQDLARVHGVKMGRGHGNELRPRLIEAQVPLDVTVRVRQ